MANPLVHQVIALASQLSEEERRVIVDAIAPKGSLAELTDQWQAEIARRASRLRAGFSPSAPAEDVFDRAKAKLAR